MTLLFLYELNPKEAAKLLHFPMKKIYSSKYEAIKKLRLMLSEELPVYFKEKEVDEKRYLK